MNFWYTTAVDCIREWLTDICLIGAAATATACAVAKLIIESGKCRMRAETIPQFSILHPRFSIHTAVFAFFALIATLCAQKPDGTNEPPRSGNVELRMENVELRNLPSLNEGEQHHNSTLSILHSQLSIATNDSYSYVMSSNGVLYSKWWRRGAWEDMLRVEFTPGWVFPSGSNHLSSVDVVSQGALRRRWTDTDEIASVGARLALVPFASTFSHELTPSNSYRFVWSAALAERRADAPVDAAIELFRDGVAKVETNGVSRLVERTWVYGATNAAMSRADAEAAVAGDWQYVFAVDFASAPPETVCLCVGTNRIAVAEAGECCFVLDKGTHYDISLSFVPDGVTCSWGGGSESRGPMRSGLVTERIEAFGSSGEVDFDDPTDDGEGSILLDHSLYISPDSLHDPTYPVRLLAWMDIPPDKWPQVSWSGGDGEISESGEWLTLDHRPDTDMISVTATYRGGTWQGYVVFWADVADDVVALDGGGTIFVESTYTNYPGELTVRTSTEQRLTAHWALRNDGTLTLSATEGAAVSVKAGSPDGEPVDLPYEWYGYSGDVDSMDFYVTNNDPSRAGEPVTFELEFDGDIEGYASDTSGMLEVVKYRVEADADWPSNKIRHVFGPRETFKAIIENGPSFGFDAPLTPGEYNMSFDYNGSTCTFPIRVIAPNGIAGTKVINDGECMGDVIGAGFLARMQVLPTYVSFAFGLGIMEEFAPVSGRWGCFLDFNKYPSSQFAHTEARGARNPLRIQAENIVEGLDQVQTRLVELPAEDGGYTLNIPVKWGIDGGPYVHDIGHVPMTIHVQTDGTVSVSKFGITARRKQNGYYQ